MDSVLKKAREDQGITIEDMARKVKIRRQYLSAIEESRYDELPGNIYAQGYLKIYANALGVNLSECSPIITSSNPEFWTKPQLAKYGGYKVILSLSLLGILCIFCWNSLEEYDQVHHLNNETINDEQDEGFGENKPTFVIDNESADQME